MVETDYKRMIATGLLSIGESALAWGAFRAWDVLALHNGFGRKIRYLNSIDKAFDKARKDLPDGLDLLADFAERIAQNPAEYAVGAAVVLGIANLMHLSYQYEAGKFTRTSVKTVRTYDGTSITPKETQIIDN